MKGPHEYTLQDLLKTIYEQNEMTDIVYRKAAIDAYNEVVGEMIAQLSRNFKLKKDVLQVQLSSAALRQEMSYRKDSLLAKINEKMTEFKLKDIVFF
ncbi:MAG: DUF721 domain-containing protein [Bacteroidales bacterium]|nr:DUF721 domain-containing protein [Bacteroidales bacterium]